MISGVIYRLTITLHWLVFLTGPFAVIVVLESIVNRPGEFSGDWWNAGIAFVYWPVFVFIIWIFTGKWLVFPWQHSKPIAPTK